MLIVYTLSFFFSFITINLNLSFVNVMGINAYFFIPIVHKTTKHFTFKWLLRRRSNEYFPESDLTQCSIGRRFYP